MKRLQVLQFENQVVMGNQLSLADTTTVQAVPEPGKTLTKVLTFDDEAGKLGIILWDPVLEEIRAIRNAYPESSFGSKIGIRQSQDDYTPEEWARLTEVERVRVTHHLPYVQAFLVMLLSHGYLGYHMTPEVSATLASDYAPQHTFETEGYINVGTIKDVQNGLIPRNTQKCSQVLCNILRELGVLKGNAWSTLGGLLGTNLSRLLTHKRTEETRHYVTYDLNTSTGQVEVKYASEKFIHASQQLVKRRYTCKVDPKNFSEVAKLSTDLLVLGYKGAHNPTAKSISRELMLNGNAVSVPRGFLEGVEKLCDLLVEDDNLHSRALFDAATSWHYSRSRQNRDYAPYEVLYSALMTHIYVNSISLLENAASYHENQPSEVVAQLVRRMLENKVRDLRTLFMEGMEERTPRNTFVREFSSRMDNEIRGIHYQKSLYSSDLFVTESASINVLNAVGVYPQRYEKLREDTYMTSTTPPTIAYVGLAARAGFWSQKEQYLAMREEVEYCGMDYAYLLSILDVTTQASEILSPIKKISKAVARYAGGRNVLRRMTDPDSVLSALAAVSTRDRATYSSEALTFLLGQVHPEGVFSESMLEWWESEDIRPLILGVIDQQNSNATPRLNMESTRSFLNSIANSPLTPSQRQKVFVYVFSDAVQRQRVSSPKSEYRDYIFAFSELVRLGFRDWERFDVTPYSLRLAHDIITSEYQELKKGIAAEIFATKYEGLRNMNLEMVPVLEDYRLVLPYEEGDLKDEGKALSHCVGGYGTRILNDNCLITFLRHKDNLDQSYITVEFNIHLINHSVVYTLGHIEGDRDNRIPDKKYQTALRELVKEMNSSQIVFEKTGVHKLLVPKKKGKGKTKTNSENLQLAI